MRNPVPTGVGICIGGIDCCGIDYYGIELPIFFPLLPPHTAVVRILLISLNQIPLLDADMTPVGFYNGVHGCHNLTHAADSVFIVTLVCCKRI